MFSLNNDSLVSVIMPVFNVRPYINEALDSLINQTYKNLEIIIVDDGSTDGSGEICDKYAAKDKRIRLIHQENRGVSTARNVALDLMTGEFVAFIDADDAYEPEFISTMLGAIIRENSDIIQCRYTAHPTTERMKLLGHEKLYPEIVGGGTRNCKHAPQLALRKDKFVHMEQALSQKSLGQCSLPSQAKHF